MVRAQFQIQQMAFMIIALFLLFIFAGLFFVGWQITRVQESATSLEEESVISSLENFAEMSEFNCDSGESLCLDEDKLLVLAGGGSEIYREFWDVASIKVYKVYPKFEEEIVCPGTGCNYYNIFESGDEVSGEYSTYVSICKKIKDSGYVYDDCEIGKILLGVKDVV